MGDLILREPMFRALARGKDMNCLILAQAQFVPLMRCLAPTATVVGLPNDFNGNGAAELAVDDAGPIAKSIGAWRPELMVFAEWHWSRLEERISAELPAVPVVGFDACRIGAHPDEVTPVRFLHQVKAGIELTEIEKNRLMAAQLGVTVGSGDLPTMTASAAALESAAKVLERAKLPVGGYWLGARRRRIRLATSHLRKLAARKVGGGAVTASSSTAGESLLTGSPDERRSSRKNCASATWPTSAITHRGAGRATDPQQLVGLAASSRGYIGREHGSHVHPATAAA